MTEVSESFGTRLQQTFGTAGRLCVGIDPHAGLLSDWGLPESAAGARDFGLRVVDAVAGRAGILKPQVAFYERHGSAGYAALEDVMAAARAAGLLIIADAKRGDIDSSALAYAQAWLTPGAPLEADAMTVSGYLGAGSLLDLARYAAENAKGLFLLAATSNPEGFELQTARTADGWTVASQMVESALQLNEDQEDFDVLGSFGVVIGATAPLSRFSIEQSQLTWMPILAPGFGHQGAKISQLPELFGSAAQNVLVSASRSILSAGPDGLVGAIDAHLAEVAACLV